MSNGQPTAPGTTVYTGSPTNPTIPTISPTTRPLLFTGLILPSPTFTTTPIPIKFITKISETLVDQEEDLTFEQVFHHVAPVIEEFTRENSAKHLDAAKKAGMGACVSCGNEARDVAYAFELVIHARRILVRGGAVCCPPGADNEAGCRTKATQYLKACQNADIESIKEKIPVTVEFYGHKSIASPETTGQGPSVMLMPAGPIIAANATEESYRQIVERTSQLNSVTMQMTFLATAMKCGVCNQNPAIDLQRIVIPLPEKGMMFHRTMPICHQAGAEGECGRKAADWLREKIDTQIEEEKRNGFMRGFGAEGWCNRCGNMGKLKKCARCENVMYCSQDCQKLDWHNGGHKEICKKI